MSCATIDGFSVHRIICRVCAAVYRQGVPHVCARCGGSSWACVPYENADSRLLLRLLARQMGIVRQRWQATS